MAIYNAWRDRVPIMMFAGNGLDVDFIQLRVLFFDVGH